MILSVRLNNFLVYSSDIELSLNADMRIKKFNTNVKSFNGFDVLKSACIYGPNNSGKTCLIRAIDVIKQSILGKLVDYSKLTNLFIDNKIVTLGVTFSSHDNVYSYDFKYDTSIENNYFRGYIYESLKQITLDKHLNKKEYIIFIKDVDNKQYYFKENDNLSKLMQAVSNNTSIIYSINTSFYKDLDFYKNLLIEFALSLEVISMEAPPVDKMIKLFKEDSELAKSAIEIIKLADLDIDDFLYNKDMDVSSMLSSLPQTMFNPEVDKNTKNMFGDLIRFTSIHKGKQLTSLIYDSLGTRKVIAISAFIVDALKNGKTLVVDEFNSSLHFKMSKALVSLFNNSANDKGQIILTAHDASLLDCKNLFRKDQIWFSSRDKEGEYLYSLKDFTSENDGVRSDSNIAELYNKGVFGAIPEPDLIQVLLDINKNGGK